MKTEILIVDDEKDIRSAIEGLLVDEGYQIRAAATAEEALELIQTRQPDLIILDIWLEGGGMDGMACLARVKEKAPDLPVLMISGHGNIETAVSAIQTGAYDFIEKPFKSDRILLLVRRALESARLKRENRELRIRISGPASLEGHSPQITQIRALIQRVAPTNSRVLITGAPGTGKDVAARLIHTLSKRREYPYVVLNCATMHPDHFESELFGTENDLTGKPEKLGVLEQANGGSLFLDEVADMPLETQGKIVRVLQEQNFRRLNGREPVATDVRIIAATNRDLEQQIEAGKFRQDLYYRLNVVPLKMFSLSERREDIPALALYFMEQAALSAGTTARQFTDEALAVMQACNWPGNVRQLRNVIEWLLIMTEPGKPMRADLLPPEIMATDLNREQNSTAVFANLPLREAREVFEREYLLSQITRFGGNISRTAGFVGMERSALHRKLKSLGIQNNEPADNNKAVAEQ